MVAGQRLAICPLRLSSKICAPGARRGSRRDSKVDMYDVFILFYVYMMYFDINMKRSTCSSHTITPFFRQAK